MKSIFLCLIVVVIGLVVQLQARRESADRMHVNDVKVLTLQDGKRTRARRVSSIPQLQCIRGPCRDFTPKSVQCYNRGTDDKDEVQWECKAEMPKEYQFGRLQVSCEGYDFSGDEYILKGSCGLEYELERTGYQKESYDRYDSRYDDDYYYEDDVYRGHRSSSKAGIWVFLSIFAIIIFVIWFLGQCNSNTTTRRSAYTDTSNPPPYNPDYPGNPGNCHTHTHTTERVIYNNNNNGWWSGFGWGSAFGWGGNSWWNRGRYYSPTRTTYVRHSRPRSSFWSSSRRSSSSSSSSRSSGSSTRSTSGFGGTKSR